MKKAKSLSGMKDLPDEIQFMRKSISTFTVILFGLLAAACGPEAGPLQGQEAIWSAASTPIGAGDGAAPEAIVSESDVSVPSSTMSAMQAYSKVTQMWLQKDAAASTATPAAEDEVIPIAGALTIPLTQTGLDGKWQITGFVSSLDSAPGDAGGQAYLGREATFQEDSIAFRGQTCTHVGMQRHPASVESFFGVGYANLAAKLGLIQDQIELIDSTCALRGFQSFIQADTNTLVINLDGTFYVLRRV